VRELGAPVWFALGIAWDPGCPLETRLIEEPSGAGPTITREALDTSDAVPESHCPGRNFRVKANISKELTESTRIGLDSNNAACKTGSESAVGPTQEPISRCALTRQA